MQMKNKKAITVMSIITLILGVITLILGISLVSDVTTNAKYSASILECKTIFDDIKGKPTYWNDKDTKLFALTNLVSNSCPSKDVEVSKNIIEPAAELIEDCFKKTGTGVDIMGANSQNKNVCLFCGFIKSQSELNNFDEKLIIELEKEKYNILKEETQTTNTNQYFLYNKEFIPKSITKDKPLAVIYFSYKPDYKNDKIITGKEFSDLEKLRDDIGTQGCKFLEGLSTYATTAAYLACSSNQQTLTGIVLEEWEYSESDMEFKTDKEDSIKIIVSDKLEKLNCDQLIIPNANFD